MYGTIHKCVNHSVEMDMDIPCLRDRYFIAIFGAIFPNSFCFRFNMAEIFYYVLCFGPTKKIITFQMAVLRFQ